MARIGLGTWPLGGRAYGEVSEEQARRTVARAVELGVDLVDTADIYGDGRAERILGEVLPPRVRVIGKVGYVAEGSREQSFAEAHVRARVEASLARLCRDRFDVLMLHSPPPEVLRDRAVLALFERLLQEGIAGAVGASIASIAHAELALQWDALGSLELIYNLLDQRALDLGLLERCHARKIGVVARVPLSFGFLTGKFAPGQSIAPGDQRARWSIEQRDRWVAGAEAFRFLVRPDRSLAQAALAFCLASPGIQHAIPGMKSPEQAEHDLAAQDPARALTQEELARARSVWRTIEDVVPR